jgi:nicotinamide mononucleotide transporter PnuC
MQFFGLYIWYKQLKKTPDPDQATATVESKSLTVFQLLCCVVITACITVGFYYEIPVFSVAINKVYYFEGKFTPRFLDSLCNGFSMVAQLLSIYCYLDQWYWWAVIDIVQIVMFTGVAGYGVVINVVVMWFLFLCNAVAGFYAWTLRYRADQQNQEISCGAGIVPYHPLSGREGGSDGSGSRKNTDIEALITQEQQQQSMMMNDENETTCLDDVVLLSDPNHSSSRDPYALGNSLKGFLPRFCPLNNTSKTPVVPVRGVIIGKFWPFHAGHQYLCEEALKYCNELYVILCHRSYHEPSAEIRVDWIRKTIPSAHVMSVQDIYDPLDSKLWSVLTKAWCHFTPEYVFTSETYGEAFAKELNCKHVLIDLERAHMPTSGTALRERLQSQGYEKDYLKTMNAVFSFLPPMGQYYYAKQVIFVGNHSKELCEQFANEMRCVYLNSDANEKKALKKKELDYIFVPSHSTASATVSDQMNSKQLQEVQQCSLFEPEMNKLFVSDENSFHYFCFQELDRNRKANGHFRERLELYQRLACKSVTFICVMNEKEFQIFEEKLSFVSRELKEKLQSEKSMSCFRIDSMSMEDICKQVTV